MKEEDLVGEEKVRVEVAKAVLRWLRDLLKWCSEDPLERIEKTVELIVEHGEMVKSAFEEALEPEYRDYINVLIGFLTGGGGGETGSKGKGETGKIQESTKGEEGKGG